MMRICVYASHMGGWVASTFLDPDLEKRWLAPPQSKALRAKSMRDFIPTAQRCHALQLI
jgi:hypothetical protein